MRTLRRGAASSYRVGLLLSIAGFIAVAFLSVRAAQPTISFITPYLTNYVLIHFDTEPNRTYILQSANSLSVTSQWSSMFTGPALPYPNHYVVLDTRTAQQTFYRLSVRP